ALDKNGKEAVGGVVIARYGVNTLEVIEAVKQRIEALQAGLPKGVRIVPFYDRTQLIERAKHTLSRALIEELILVTLAHIIFLAHFRSMAIIILAFIPVFSLTGQEGKLFHPLAFTKTFAMAGATVIAITLVPVLCTLLLGGKFHSEQSNPVMRFLQAIYRPVLRWALGHRLITVLIALSLF